MAHNNKPLLTEGEVQFFHSNGYLLYNKQVFPEAALCELEGLFEEHLAGRGSKRPDELDTPHFEDERILKFLLSEEVLDLVQPIVGPNIALWSSAFLCKEPFIGRATPWHEDSAYWNGRLSVFGTVTVWLALDRVTKENGCMRVIPGTHTNGFSEYETVDQSKNTFATQVKNIDDSKAVYFELEKGECSLHDDRIIHGALPNKSAKRRCGFTMRYFPTSTKFYDENPINAGFRIWLARGKDLAGNKYVNA